jgi:hypothetical protein
MTQRQDERGAFIANFIAPLLISAKLKTVLRLVRQHGVPVQPLNDGIGIEVDGVGLGDSVV